jgi:polysaccharide chain length determinant protein (PEP-CTERM system associated)
MIPQPNTKLRPEALLENASRWRWLFIIPFCVAMIAGMYLSVTLPKVYESSTTILVQPQKVPSNYVKSLVDTDIDERLRTIQQQILSWSNLERIMQSYNLYATPEQSGMLMEDKIANLRERITVEVLRGGRGADAFTISFKATEPKLAMDVANALSSFFINENLKVREEQAMGTSSFLQAELDMLRRKLLEKEEALKEYRRQNMGGLPEQLQSNLSILGKLQEDLLEKQKALRETRAAAAALQRQAAEMQSMTNSMADFSVDDLTGPAASGEADALRQQMEALKLRYTEQHPDVLRLKRQIAALEAEAAKAPPEESPTSEPAPAFDFQSMQNVQLSQVRSDIGGQQAEIQMLNERIEMYRARVEDTPKREQELFSLKRDYDNLKEAYDALLTRKLEADLSVNMEKKQKGEQFQVLDVARLPEKPISPKIPYLFAASVVFGLGIGGALIFLLAYFDQAVRLPEEVENLVGVPTLVSIPSIIRPAEIRRRRWNAIASLCGIGLCVMLCGAFGVLTVKGVDRTVNFVSQFLG